LQQWGSLRSGEKPGEFSYPGGLAVNSQYVYICDYNNHRIQLLTKESGKYFSQWGTGLPNQAAEGQFYYPLCISYSRSEGIFYVGDRVSVQLFWRDGRCIQRLGGNSFGALDWVYGICVIDEKLYVSDSQNQRILIFQRAS